MSRSSKEPLFCCGKLHNSAIYHRRTVHQQWTKIHFKDNPTASFRIERDPKTSLFRCPECEKSWAKATLIRVGPAAPSGCMSDTDLELCPTQDHILWQCQGYAQYRAVPNIKIRPGHRETTAIEDAVVPDTAVNTPQCVQTSSILPICHEAIPSISKLETITNPDRSHSLALLYPGDQDFVAASEPVSPTTSDEASDLTSASTSGIDLSPPTLRPALWSPVKSPLLSSSASSSFSRSLVFSLCPASDVSSSSGSIAVKTEFDYLERTTGCGTDSFSPSAVRFIPADQSSSAVEAFLNGLRRPLGNAALHFHLLGLVTEADLDLICMMPEAWNELGDHLCRSGVTMIEWLMVKEAFKARAIQMSTPASA